MIAISVALLRSGDAVAAATRTPWQKRGPLAMQNAPREPLPDAAAPTDSERDRTRAGELERRCFYKAAPLEAGPTCCTASATSSPSSAAGCREPRARAQLNGYMREQDWEQRRGDDVVSDGREDGSTALFLGRRPLFRPPARGRAACQACLAGRPYGRIFEVSADAFSRNLSRGI